MTLKYHRGQIDVQTEANTRPIADMLAGWVGPVGEFCRTSDMIVLAVPGAEERLEFLAISGEAPIVEIAGPSSVLVRLDAEQGPDLRRAVPCGGIAINLAVARRARLNGVLRRSADGLVLDASEAFTNCRKYIMPSAPLIQTRHCGPQFREAIDHSDPFLVSVLAKAETSFLASISPDGTVDVSHRGGQEGFLRFEQETGVLTWDEYVGDGMFKSAGNIRATGRVALLIPDIETGDAVELVGRAEVQVQRRDKQPRMSGLLHQQDAFPVQGRVTCHVAAAYRLGALTHARRKLEKRQRVTSASPVHEQQPQ